MSTTPAKPGRRFGIRVRLLALLLPCTIGLLALDSWNDYAALRRQVQESHDRVLLAAALALRTSVTADADGRMQLGERAALARALLTSDDSPRTWLRVSVQAPSEAAIRTLWGEPDLPPPPDTAGMAAPDAAQWYEAHLHGQPVRMVALHGSLADETGRKLSLLVQAAEDTTVRRQALAHSIRQQLLRDVRMLVVLVLMVWLGVRWSLRPLDRLRDTVLHGQGGAPAPLAVDDVPQEVAPLVSALNKHVAAHRDVLDAQSQFLADASHQLRTPLAIMMAQASVALRERDPARLHETLQAQFTQIERSRRLCEQLLSLAHAGEGAAPAQPSAVLDLNALTREVVLQHLTLAHEREQDLGWVDARGPDAQSAAAADGAPVPPAVPVLASEAELREVLANLVHNAIVHTPRGGRITVLATVQVGRAVAEVSDDGPGIAASHREAVFERFRRINAQPAATGGRHGSGLGLAIARAYARRQGGDIALSTAEADGTGLRATLYLPLHASHASRPRA